jgi:hypothetical protein
LWLGPSSSSAREGSPPMSSVEIDPFARIGRALAIERQVQRVLSGVKRH